MSLLRSRPGEIEERGEKQPVFLQMVSDNYFDVLGVRAFRGRVFRQPDAGSPGEAIAVISEEYWQRHYGGDLSALGARFRFSTRELTIAGIAPPGFRGTESAAKVVATSPVASNFTPQVRTDCFGSWEFGSCGIDASL